DLEAEVTAHPDVISHHRVNFKGLPIARNYGWQLARHELIVYVDDDIRCGPELVAEHLRTLREPGVGLSAGGIDEARVEEAAPARIGVYDSWLAVAHRDF